MAPPKMKRRPKRKATSLEEDFKVKQKDSKKTAQQQQQQQPKRRYVKKKKNSTNAGNLNTEVVAHNNNNTSKPAVVAVAKKQKQYECTFRWPYYEIDNIPDIIFPPTVYSNDVKSHKNGLLIQPDTITNQYSFLNDDEESVTVTFHDNVDIVHPPVLNPIQVKLWRHKYAANSSVNLQFPITVYRLLGTITRTLSINIDTSNNQSLQQPLMNPMIGTRGKKKGNRGQYPKGQRKQTKSIVMSTAKKLAQNEIDCNLLEETKLNVRANEIQKQWETILNDNKMCVTQNTQTPWNEKGEWVFNDDNNNNSTYITMERLQRWLKSSSQFDEDTTVKELLNVIECALDLTDPDGLWNIPVLMVYPIITKSSSSSNNDDEDDDDDDNDVLPPPQKKARLLLSETTTTSMVLDSNNKKGEKEKYTIRIGIYCHRLLPELTTLSLKPIMDALDTDSYILKQPCVNVPKNNEPIFESAKYPIVCINDNDLNIIDIVDNDTMTEKENVVPNNNNKTNKLKKTNNDAITNSACNSPQRRGKTDKEEEWMTNQSSRDDTRISAFTTKGLLKLLENHGTDIITSNYTTYIEPNIISKFQIQLMLHQKHAISWMVQMESLDGCFGLNSILWEEREFLDGGQYYYSPSLGQIRLDKPPNMKGGILADEMGLGKTVEVLGLILATLPELKREVAQDGNDNKTHATLIIVPPSLVCQWQTEIVKATGNYLTVDYLDYKTGKITRRRGSSALSSSSEPDIVITTYSALEENKVAKLLFEKSWGRIVLDEMQEIRSSTTKIAQNCEQLQCNRRWMLSGTPLFEGIDDLRGELNFLKLEPFSANSEDGFFKFMISDPWENHNPRAIETLKVLSSVMLRRSKSMTIKANGAPILGLPPLTVEFVPIQQSISERAIYYFLESLVARELRNDDTSKKRTSTSRSLCLRLLRDACNSAVLLNGGLGVTPQLKSLNQLLISQARRGENARAAGETSDSEDSLPVGIPRMGCDEAIMYLAQIQESTRTGTDEVAMMSLGFGQGLSRRVRAANDPAVKKIKEAKSILEHAEKERSNAIAKKAKCLWRLAVEKVTTGMIPSMLLDRVHPKFRSLWKWRSLFLSTTHSNLPPTLMRGWRLSPSMFDVMLRNRPDFIWLHPHTFVLEGIPQEVSPQEVTNAIANILIENSISDNRVDIIEICRFDTRWKAWLRFYQKDASDIVSSKALKSHGIIVTCKTEIELLQNQKAEAKLEYDEAKSAYILHPTDENRQHKKKAKKAFELAKCGLRIVCASKVLGVGAVALSIAFSRQDSHDTQKSYYDVVDNLSEDIEKFSQTIATTDSTMNKEKKRIERLQRGVDGDVEIMSAFEALQALSDGKTDKTSCCICLEYLGSNHDGTNDSASIVMTKCGHLYCRVCLSNYAVNALQTHPCPSCRKPFKMPDEIIYIDPSKRSDTTDALARCKKAKRIVQEASRMLEESNGLLTPEMWTELYLSVDEPKGSSNSLDSRISAVPRHFLAHFRACIDGLPLYAKSSDSPTYLCSESAFLSSKVKRLLQDLPSNERSVVFSGSKSTIQHLHSVLEKLGIGCRALFTGQKVDASEHALTHWQSVVSGRDGDFIPYPVLLVQAGAAASGLTLTASCKMFLMEPFLRLSEEQQAYGRCHRYGQKNPVVVKCYYAPVSVESRLLEWRKRANEANNSVVMPTSLDRDTKIVYSAMDVDEKDAESDDDEDDDDDSDNEEETSQTKFLLGLHDQNVPFKTK